MPLYEYRCQDCNARFDYLVRDREAADQVPCQSCEGTNVRRLVSGFATVAGYDDHIVASEATRGGGCCGGSCGCSH